MPARSTTVMAFDEGGTLRALRMALQDPKSILTAVGALMRAESQRSFRDQRMGPNIWAKRVNPNWPAIVRDFTEGKPNPPAHRFRGRPAMMDTGRLKGSITWRLVGRDVVEVGSNLPYAGPLHHGLPTESDIITADVQDRLWKWMQRVTRAAKRSPGDEGKQDVSSAAGSLGWLLNPDLTGKRKTIEHPPRPIVGIPDDLSEQVEDAFGVSINVVAA